MRWTADPAALRPMLASLDSPSLVRSGWLYEPKYDGIRALADVTPPPPTRRGGEARVVLYSRNGLEKQQQFPAIARALSALGGRFPGPVVIDGEIVAIDGSGQPLGFQQIQGRIGLTSPADIARAEAHQAAAFIMFDLLRDGEDDLRPLPLAARRLRLHERLGPPSALPPLLRLSEMLADDGRPLLRRAQDEGWEGLIAKDASSVYVSGKRTGAWRKLKIVSSQELVIGGWTEPRKARSHFGALLLGYYDARGALCYAGNVGTGFDQGELDRVAALLAPRSIRRSPFAGPVRTLERAHWVTPDLVAEVRFTEWTADGLLRHPVYLGLRSDKAARDVRRESTRGASAALEPALAATPAAAPSAAARHLPLPRQSVTIPEAEMTARRRPQKSVDEARATKGPRQRANPAQTPYRLPAAYAALIARLQSLEDSRKDGELELPNGDTLRVTNLSKPFWPALGITKGDLLRFYVEVAPLILPTVDDRPLVMRRFPNGVGNSAFYQQRHPETPPPGVRREVLSPDIEPIDEEGPRDRLIGGSLTTLLYMTQLAAVSQDPWFSRVATAPFQDFAAIDLDPGDGVGFARVLDVARWVKEELDTLDIPAVPKTSGASGLHIYVRLPPRTTYETGQLLCQLVASAVASKHPAAATIERWVKRRRPGTVYVDYLQNILGKTLATAYSARASDYAGVSTPLTWAEVDAGVDPREFTVRTAPARFRQVGDLWRPVLKGKAVDLKALIGRSSRRG